MITDLEKQFKFKGGLFKQVFSNSYGYVYSVTFPCLENPLEHKKQPNHFEVFARKIGDGFDFETKVIDKDNQHVRYPKDNDFGIWAFTVFTLERAKEILKRFEENGLKNQTLNK